MLKHSISRSAFAAVLFAISPALADENALSQSVNALSQQVQTQQQQIDRLMKALNEKKTAKKNVSIPVTKSISQTSEPMDAAQVYQAKPGVVAPLQPAMLGTLRLSEAQNPASVRPLTPPQLPVYAQPQQAPAATYVPAATASLTVYHPQTQAALATPTPAPSQPQAATSKNAPGFVGEAPAANTKPPEVQALSNVGGVLTPYGKMVVEPFFQYSRSSVNTFVFQGVSVVSSVLIGSVEANKTARDLVSSGATFRVGVSDRLELEARIPYVYRADSITNTIPNSNNQSLTQKSQGHGIGDLELAAHYQINDGRDEWPFFIGNLRYKSDTGSSPYNSQYNSDGSAHTLATGSGFNAIEPSVTAIFPSDPATLFANLGYIHSFGEDINHSVGNNQIGRVSPGDTYSASLGMGIALNDRLSFTLGYEHDYVRPTQTVIAGLEQSSQSLQVGSALTGISYRLSPRTSINVSLATGVTRDAPDAVLGVRVPITLQAF